MTEDAQSSPTTLTRSGVVRLVTVFVSIILVSAAFFAAAGTLDLPRAWLYYGGTLTYFVIAVPLMLALFPGAIEVVNERGRLRKDVQAWDKVFAVAYTLLLLATPVVAGLDAGRLGWSAATRALAIPAFVVTILANMLVHWAMIVNRHAETGVRIQQERHHEVVSSGPYRFVRHPFYVSIAVTQLVYPLAVGALYAYIPCLAVVGLVVWRTAHEDAFLRAELLGYVDYAERVRYRLLPGVW